MASSHNISTVSSALYQSTVGGSETHIHTETFEDRIRQWKTWLYGSDSLGGKLVMGRSLMDWVLLIGCYLGLLAMLSVLFVTSMAAFYWWIHWNYPPIQGSSSMLQTPGMGFRPQSNIHSTVIRYIKGDLTTYTNHIDQIESYLKFYENQNQQGEKYIDCNEIDQRRIKDLDKVCRFDLINLGENCVKQQNFGFDNGQPCVLLKLNRVFDWMPEEYTNDTVPDAISDVWSQWWITVTCDGESPADRENMGSLSYYPANGFHFKYFPFRNQQGYRSPLVFVFFEDPRPGHLLMMSCKAWARNIVHDSNEMIGMTHFELMVD